MAETKQAKDKLEEARVLLAEAEEKVRLENAVTKLKFKMFGDRNPLKENPWCAMGEIHDKYHQITPELIDELAKTFPAFVFELVDRCDRAEDIHNDWHRATDNVRVLREKLEIYERLVGNTPHEEKGCCCG